MTVINTRTPEYVLDNLDAEIVITLHAPLSKLNDTNYLLEKNVFVFSSNPYFLK